MKYVSLHNSTIFSIMASVIRPEALMKYAKENGMKAVAVTDRFTLSGIWGSYKTAKDAGVKLIVGCSLNFVYDLDSFGEAVSVKDKKKLETIKNIVLIAKNKTGYVNLLNINRESFDTRYNKQPLISWRHLEKYSEGLVLLTGDASGILAYELCNNNKEKAIENYNRLSSIFGEDLYVEFIPNNLRVNECDQFVANRALYNLYKELDFNVVATSGAKYLNKDHAKYLELVNCVKKKFGFDPDNVSNNQQYLHTYEDIFKLFKRNFGEEFADLVCANSVRIAKKCEKPEWIKPEVISNDKIQLPTYPIQDHNDYNDFLSWKESVDDSLKHLADDKLFMRFLCYKNLYKVPQDKLDIYKQRLEMELPVFEQLGFSSYMLITYDFIDWAVKHDIPVGSGRGSCGGSVVGYLLSIHQADPIKYGLVFERFLNIEKTSFPDIDNDFDADGRERVLQYVTAKYGSDYVAHVSNLLTFTPKVALTDVITCLQIGGDRKEAFRIAKNITETIDAKSKTLDSAIESSKLLEEFLNEHPEVKEYAASIIGLVRSWATHAAGVIIGKYPLKGLAPLRLDDNGVVVLEWEKEQTEENGLVKVDFLGLETLSIIKNAENIRASLNKPKLPPINYDHYYKEVYDLIKNGNTAGIFQLGASGGTVGLCNMTEPTKIEDVAVINALARPGVPPDIKKSYINRKFGKEQVIIPHKNLERAVKDTFGYCIFEESFLFLAHDFCGWNLEKGDKMRKVSKMKAKGKKLLDEMHEDFIESSTDYSGVNEDLSRKIWDEWIVPLSGYAFNKSHSILYSMTSLQTAYWKAYSANEFLTANLISETRKNNPKSKANVLKYIQELQANGVQICTPDINDSFATYRLISDDKLLTGFSSLHGVKEPAALDIIEKRPFSSFEDFLLRTDSSKVRISVVQALAASGALDCFGLPRKTMCLYASELRKKLKAVGKTTHKVSYTLPKEEFSIGEIRSLEMKYLGRAISGTKNHSFPKLFSGNKAIRLVRDIVGMKEKANITVEGEIVDMFSFKVGKKESKIFGQDCLRVVLEDINNEPIKIIFFPDAFQKLKDMYGECFTKKFEKGFGIRVSGHVNHFDNQISIVANEIYGIFLPVDASNKFENKKPQFVITNNKKPKDISQDDIEKDLLLSMEKT